jgi:programmed cell death 6-interacting protein
MLVDSINADGKYSSQDCLSDLKCIANLRKELACSLHSKDAHENALLILPSLHVYYHYLKECELKGIGSSTSSRHSINLEWESGMMVEVQVGHSIQWERANIIWNIATLEAYAAFQRPRDKGGYSAASKHLQIAASWIHQLSSTISKPFPYMDFYPTFIQLWKGLLLAESQRCAFESLKCVPTPRHMLLAKLAVVAAPMYINLEMTLKHAENNDSPIFQQTLVKEWAALIPAWGAYMKCLAEFHQSIDCNEKGQNGEEMTRLDLAMRYACECSDSCERYLNIVASLHELHNVAVERVTDIGMKMTMALPENEQQLQEVIPQESLPEIRGQLLSDVMVLEKILKPYKGSRLFGALVAGTSPSSPTISTIDRSQQKEFRHPNSSKSRRRSHRERRHSRKSISQRSPKEMSVYVQSFRADMKELVDELTVLAEELAESARSALATVNLPHSLTAYRCKIAGGGIPDELWERVQCIQTEQQIPQLKQDLWRLRDTAEIARNTYQQLLSQMDIDLQNHESFRQANPNFQGRDAKELQAPYRKHMVNNDKLLTQAQEGDQVLFKRLDNLDLNPKYKLLQCQKPQLDRLLPGLNSDHPPIDVSRLDELLEDLSALIASRNLFLKQIEDKINSFDIKKELETRVAPDSAVDDSYIKLIKQLSKPFHDHAITLKSDTERQSILVHSILAENKRFRLTHRKQMGVDSKASDSCIVMLEDALEEIDQIGKNMKEGKEFYSAVTPSLNKMRVQIEDISARLTVERIEFGDTTGRSHQEQADAAMAKQMSCVSPAIINDPAVKAQEEADAAMARRLSRINPNAMMSAAAQAQEEADAEMAKRLSAALSPEVDPAAKAREEADAAMARRLSRTTPTPNFASPTNNDPYINSAASQDSEETGGSNKSGLSLGEKGWVDDEKVATLIGMDFDPARAYEALRKNNNDVGKALNDLLTF